MSLFSKLKDPVFFKESHTAETQLEQLRSLYDTASEALKSKIDQEMKRISYGISGENNIAFELKNSHMPMYVLHDLYLKKGDLTAQIDYLIITKKKVFVLECKNLIGNIEINSSGDFVRVMEQGGRKTKIGIYSPITQNRRHMELLKEIRSEKYGFLTKASFLNNFENNYKSLVVLANPKTILNDKYAKKEIKNQVIRYDQLIDYIKKANESIKYGEISDAQMLELAEFYLSKHVENTTDYLNKFTKQMEEPVNQEQETVAKKEQSIPIPSAEQLENNREKPQDKNQNLDELRCKLRQYRLKKSREEQVKPYFLFNDKQMEELIEKCPITAEDLLQVSGFGEVKVRKYGDDIIAIICSRSEDIYA